MDVSHLQVKVTGDGIAETSRKLGGLGTTADNTEKKVGKLTDRIEKLIGVQSRLNTTQQSATAAANSQAAAFSNLHSVVGQIAAQMQAMASAIALASANMSAMSQHANLSANALQNKAKWGNVATSTLKAMATAASVYAAGRLLGSIVKQADAWQMMGARLEVATGSMKNAKIAQEQIYDLSQKLRAPLEDTTKLYTRLAPAMAKMGKDSNQAREMVEGVATALKLSGATAGEASSVMLQFSQSVNAGRLNGAEFNAVAEGAPKILNALEDATGKTRGELKKMGADGKISIELLQSAMEKALPKWREDFEKLPVTFEDGLTRIGNAWTRAIGLMGEDTGFNKELNAALGVIERTIPAIAQGLGNAFVSVMKWVEANREKIGQIWDQVVLLAKDIWDIGGGIGQWLGKLLGAGDQVSLIASGIFGVRLVMAGIVDLSKLLLARIIDIGAGIYDFWMMPINLVVGAVQKLLSLMIGTTTFMSKLSGAIGAQGAADDFKAIATSYENFSKSLSGYHSTAAGLSDKARGQAKALTAEIENGGGAIQDVLDGMVDLKTKARGALGSYDENFNKNPKGAGDDKADKAAAKAAKEYAHELENLNQKIKEQQELQARLTTFGLGYDKLSEGTKKRIEYETQLADLERNGASQKERDSAAILLVQAKELEGLETINQRKIAALQFDKAAQDAAAMKLKSLTEEAVALEYKAETYGKAKGAVEAMELAADQARLAELNAMPIQTEHQIKMVKLLESQLVARERIAVAAGKLGEMEAMTDLNKQLDSMKAVKFGKDFADAFGKAGKAIGGVVDAFERMNQRQAKTNKLQEAYAKTGVKNANVEEKIRDQQLKDELDTYADMASAAKGFFDEKSKGYKVMEAAERGFRLMELALEMKSFALKIGNTLGLTTAKIAGDQAISTSAVAAAGVQVGADQATAASGAVSGVVNQAKGDPYTAFPRMAAMAAIMAALGFAVGAFGGSKGSAPPPTATGKGTVFGDSEATSKSLSNSIEFLADIDSMTMKYSAQMARSLLNIEASLGSVANLVLRDQTGVTSGGNFGIQTGTLGKYQGDPALNGIGLGFLNKAVLNLPVLGTIIGKLQSLWGSTKQEIIGAGVYIDGSLSQLRNGQGFSQYADVKTTKRRYGGLKKDESYSTFVEDLDSGLARQFGMVLDQMADAVATAGEALGVSTSLIETRLNAFVLNIGRIDLRGLNGEQIQEKLEAVFGAAGDSIAKAVIPGMEDFQKVGEGYLETVIRVSSSMEQAAYELDKLGITAIGVRDVVNKQGDISAEIVRQSIMMVEAGSGVGEIMQVLTGNASDLATAYSELTSARRALNDVGLGNDVTFELIRAAGGLGELRDALEAYTEGFFSDAEQRAMKVGQMSDEFQRLGLVMPATKDAFRSMVESLKAGGNDSLAIKVMMLAESFSDMSDLLASDTQVLNDARNALSEAYERESGALKETKERFLDFVSSLQDFRGSLLTGELSTLSDSDKLSILSDRLSSTAASAMGGDEKAMGAFESVAQEFLTFSREYNASGAQYTADFQRVMDMTLQLESMAQGRATVAEQQLEQMTLQVGALITINESVLSVAQAIAALQGVDGSHANGLAYVPYDGYTAELHEGERVLTAAESRAYNMDWSSYGSGGNAALVEEIKALRGEVAQLREQQSNETAALIGSNYDASERNAQAVVEGTKDAVSTGTYTERAKVKIA